MGNNNSQQEVGCKYRCNEILQQTRNQISRFHPFSHIQEQKSYAVPIQQNIYAPSKQMEQQLKQIMSFQKIKQPKCFQNQVGYKQDERFWKKQNPNIIIQGNWKENYPHGLCKIYFPKGKQIFVSYFKNGIPLFQDCILILQDCSYYHGQIQNFQFHGQGKYVNSNESVIYEGQWSHNVPSGKGIQIIIDQKLIYQYQGDFNKNGEKDGIQSVLRIKNNISDKQTILQYKGQFKNNDMTGQSILTTQNGNNILKGVVKSQIIKVQKLQTQKFLFQGELSRDFLQGQGKVIQKDSNLKITCHGKLQNGQLHGKGSISYQDGRIEQVCWYQGLKLKHLRHFQDQQQFKQIISKVQDEFKKATKYSQLTKTLTQYFNTHHAKHYSKKQFSNTKQRFIFQMITDQKAKTIIQSKHKGNDASPVAGQHRKQLIIELDKGKNLYMSTYHLHLASMKSLKQVQEFKEG